VSLEHLPVVSHLEVDEPWRRAKQQETQDGSWHFQGTFSTLTACTSFRMQFGEIELLPRDTPMTAQVHTGKQAAKRYSC